MAQSNTKMINRPKNHEGVLASKITPLEELHRTVMACLLWEDTFYESGESIVDRISKLVGLNTAEDVSKIAIKARSEYHLRHVPLLLAVEMTEHFKSRIVGDTIFQVIQRADEISEILAIYWRNGKRPLANQLKRGLARAYHKFNKYQLAKYDRNKIVTLRDATFLSHVKSYHIKKGRLTAQLVNKTYYPEKTKASGFPVKSNYNLTLYEKLEAPDTWEVALSGGEDKKETFTRLIQEKKLGYMALLRNLRNMRDAGVDRKLIIKALNNGAIKSKALPFRFISAAKSVPEWEDIIDIAMQIACGSFDILPGHTVIAVDCSASMQSPISNKTIINRFEAAAALAILIREISDSVSIYAYGSITKKIQPRFGMALRDALANSNVGWETNLGDCVNILNEEKYDRAIIITDEQTRQPINAPKGLGYLINVAPFKYGIGYDSWLHIDGFSETTIQYIQEYEGAIYV